MKSAISHLHKKVRRLIVGPAKSNPVRPALQARLPSSTSSSKLMKSALIMITRQSSSARSVTTGKTCGSASFAGISVVAGTSPVTP